MKLFRATGFCSACSEFVKLEGIGNEKDAEMLFHQEHMADKAHWFEGAVEISSYEEDQKPGKKYKGVRR